VCSYEPVTVSPVLGLLHADNTVTDSLLIKSAFGNTVRDVVPPSSSHMTFSSTEIYPFTTDTKDVAYLVSNYIGFSSKGSWAADSAYFFGYLLDSYGCQTSYKTTQ